MATFSFVARPQLDWAWHDDFTVTGRFALQVDLFDRDGIARGNFAFTLPHSPHGDDAAVILESSNPKIELHCSLEPVINFGGREQIA